VLSERYQLTERIAAGGMGEVWRGTDLLLHRPVAVKVLLPGLADDTGFIARFRTEARMMASLRHPGIVQVYDFGESGDGNLDFLVMEFIEGTSLAKRIEAAGKLDAGETVAIVGQVADALQAAHEAGIIHRDVKPSNLLVRPGGAIVLVDFGVARSTTGAGLTGTNVVMGSAHYMAPEQAEGKPITPATDVYALGAVAYTCLTGRPPYIGDNPLQVIAQLVVADPPTLPVDVPPQVAAVVLRALEKDPSARHQSAASFAAATRVALTGQGPSRRMPPTAQPPTAQHPTAQHPTVPAPQFRPTPGAPAAAGAGGGGENGGPAAPMNAGPPSAGAAAPAAGWSVTNAGPGAAAPAAGWGSGNGGPGAVANGGAGSAGNGGAGAAGWSTGPGGSGGAGRRRKVGLVAAGAVLLVGAGLGLALALRPDPSPAQGRPPGAGRIDVPNFGGGGGPGEQKPIGLPTSASGRSVTPGATATASARTPAGVLPSTRPAGAEPSVTGPGPEPSPTATSASVINPYTPRSVCGAAFVVIDQAPLKGADGTLLGRVYLLYNATNKKNCTTTIKTTDIGTATAAMAYLEPEGAARVTDSGSFQYYAGPVKGKAGATCVKWGGSIGDLAYDSPLEHCD
jgi:serine/threonine-protein kinase